MKDNKFTEGAILTNDKVFCSIHCLVEACNKSPKQFLNNEIENRDPEGQVCYCDNCRVSYYEEN